ncbi:hypothetical protein ACJEMZ_24955, partial [Escherichia coli]
FLTSCWLLPQNEQYRTFSLELPFFSAMGLLGEEGRNAQMMIVQTISGPLWGLGPRFLLESGAGIAPSDSGTVFQHLIDQAVRLGL